MFGWAVNYSGGRQVLELDRLTPRLPPSASLALPVELAGPTGPAFLFAGACNRRYLHLDYAPIG